VEHESVNVTTLVEKAQQGNRAAFQELVRLYQDDIYKMMFYRTYSQMDAEDLTQEVFIQAFRRIKTLKNNERFRSWLFSISINRCRDLKRKRRLLNFFGMGAWYDQDNLADMDTSTNDQVLDTIQQEKFWEQVKKLLHDLSDSEREVFTMRFMEQLKISEIAEVINKNESTVKTHLYRALQKIKKQSSSLQEFREFLP
jgi:RNA polymerase sigma-70 factor (ECF subfamily)